MRLFDLSREYDMSTNYLNYAKRAREPKTKEIGNCYEDGATYYGGTTSRYEPHYSFSIVHYSMNSRIVLVLLLACALTAEVRPQKLQFHPDGTFTILQVGYPFL